MTQKLKILGPYTPEHEGPFCTRNKLPVDLKVRDGRGIYPLFGYIADNECLDGWTKNGEFEHGRDFEDELDLMNAEEVPQPRDFWIVGVSACMSLDKAEDLVRRCGSFKPSIIHVREVLPGESK